MAAVPPLTVDLDLFTDEEIAALIADPVTTAVPDGVELPPDDLLYTEDDGWFDPFAEPLPGDGEVALAGRDGDRAGQLLAGSCRAGRDTLARLTEQAVRRLLADDDWGSHLTLFTDEELTELRNSISAVRVNGDLLGRSRVRRLAEMGRGEPVAVSFAEGYQAFDCPRCGAVMYDGDPPRQTKYKLSALCEDCGHRCPQTGLKPAAQRFAESPEEAAGAFDVFDDDLPVQSPADAVSYFRRLVPDVSVRRPERYAPLFDREAFTLAVHADAALLKRVQATIAQALEQGGSRATVAGNIEDLLRDAGVHPQNPQYADLVYRTNAMDAYVQGQQAEYADPRMQEAFPAWEYHAIPDERARPHHAARDGRLYSPALTFQEVRGADAANVINCRCSWSPVHRREVARRIAAGEPIHEG